MPTRTHTRTHPHTHTEEQGCSRAPRVYLHMPRDGQGWAARPRGGAGGSEKGSVGPGVKEKEGLEMGRGSRGPGRGDGGRKEKLCGSVISTTSQGCPYSVSSFGKPGTFTFKAAGTPSPSNSVGGDTAVLSRKPPTRRPSLAGIFGLGQSVAKADADAGDAGENAKRDASSPDCDRIEIAQQTSGTIRGTKRLKSKRSLIGPSVPSPSLRLRLGDIHPSPDKPSL
ncbi:hypothetical protein JB92DRAFT_3130528 [Gautieria morchelliformis]|nr:hypothetical protein JB92DRAFT_3130528 [Gautieria morchelliformis]